MKTSSSFGLACGTVVVGLAILVVACGGAESIDVLGAPGATTGTTSGVTTSSGATSGNTSSGNTSSGNTSSGNTSSGSTSGQTSSGCVKCGIALPPGCKFTSECGCDYTCPDGGGPLKCTWTQDGKGNCPDGSYCDTTDCVTGVCVKRIDGAGTDRNPQCGCDGVTYWNATYAKRAGMAIRSGGACKADTGKVCGGLSGASCPGGGSCNMQVAKKSECNTSDGAGLCWILPSQCPAIAIGGRSRPCGAAAVTCTDDCTAIKKQSAWFDDSTCPQ